jgi:hypothetical protein
MGGASTLGMTPEQIAANESLLAGQSALTEQSLAGSQQLYADEMADIANGGKIDPETAAYIDEVYGHEMKTALDEVAQVLAPSRGLRPTDVPVQDRAFTVAGEIGAAAAQAKLDYPLAQGELTSSRRAGLFDVGEAATAFQDQLAQNAFLNRQALLETSGELGLGIATATGTAPGTTATNLQGNRYSVVPTNVSGTTTSFDFGELFDSIF